MLTSSQFNSMFIIIIWISILLPVSLYFTYLLHCFVSSLINLLYQIDEYSGSKTGFLFVFSIHTHLHSLVTPMYLVSESNIRFVFCWHFIISRHSLSHNIFFTRGLLVSFLLSFLPQNNAFSVEPSIVSEMLWCEVLKARRAHDIVGVEYL